MTENQYRSTSVRNNWFVLAFLFIVAKPFSLSLFCRLADHLRKTKAAIIFQKQYRMLRIRRAYQTIRQAAITIQSFTRGMFVRKNYQKVCVFFLLCFQNTQKGLHFRSLVFFCFMLHGSQMQVAGDLRPIIYRPFGIERSHKETSSRHKMLCK